MSADNAGFQVTVLPSLFERLSQKGPESLSDEELLSLVLQTDDFQEVRSTLSVFSKSYGESLKRNGVKKSKRGDKKIGITSACLELGRRFLNSSHSQKPQLDTPARVWQEIPVSVKTNRKEHFVAFYLNCRNQVVHYEVVSIGTLSASLVHPREVFAPAFTFSAASLIVAHNHPSGDIIPSPEDKGTTKRLKEAGQLLGIPLLDHLIVSTQEFFSFKEYGLLDS